MVSKGMRRYRQRSSNQARLIGENGGHEFGNEALSNELLDYETIFNRQAPIRLEVGFGHGEFLSNMAEVHPEEEFIGIELQELRVTKTAHKSNKRNAHNVCLYRGEAHAFVRQRIAQASLKRAYVLFSDPWPKSKHRRRRLMNRSFLLDLIYTIEEGGKIEIATDTLNYCFQVLSNFSCIENLVDNAYAPQGYRINIPTRFPTVFEIHKK
ncbi:MAG: tRNA (guanosine(46)-N7)-methyltransferase TrmB, partial [Planctomycetes bacterium]|nr:tRNA (guanosine(46)-N7)-methyltransferase TrmB [Planctomycetota bacterium]